MNDKDENMTVEELMKKQNSKEGNAFTNFAKGKLGDAKDSYSESRIQKKESAELAKQKKEEFKIEQDEYKKIFRATQKMGDIEIDDTNKLLKINNASSNIKSNSKMKMLGKGILAMYTLGASIAVEMALKPSDIIFRYDEIKDYDLLENNLSVESGGLGRAIVGGVVAGPVGGILGLGTKKRKTKKSVDMLALQITTTNFCFPSLIITYIKSETKTKSSKYTNALSKARSTISCLSLIFDQTSIKEEQHTVTQEISTHTQDPYEELKKVKELLDMGVITEEEFEIKKKELLKL